MTEEDSKILQKLKENEPLLDWYKFGEEGSSQFLAVDTNTDNGEDMNIRIIQVKCHRGSGRLGGDPEI